MRIEWLLTEQRMLGGFQRLGYHVQSYAKCLSHETLRHDGAWRWLVEEGQHRFAVSATL